MRLRLLVRPLLRRLLSLLVGQLVWLVLRLRFSLGLLLWFGLRLLLRSA